MYSFICYVPGSHLEQVKNALFAAGAGMMDGYERCCWQVLGQGQFMPTAKTHPFVGEEGKTAIVAEYRIEMVVDEIHAAQAVRALLETHPYEVPAYHLIPVMKLMDA